MHFKPNIQYLSCFTAAVGVTSSLQSAESPACATQNEEPLQRDSTVDLHVQTGHFIPPLPSTSDQPSEVSHFVPVTVMNTSTHSSSSPLQSTETHDSGESSQSNQEQCNETVVSSQSIHSSYRSALQQPQQQAHLQLNKQQLNNKQQQQANSESKKFRQLFSRQSRSRALVRNANCTEHGASAGEPLNSDTPVRRSSRPHRPPVRFGIEEYE